jgi:hypothetical protein
MREFGVKNKKKNGAGCRVEEGSGKSAEENKETSHPQGPTKKQTVSRTRGPMRRIGGVRTKKRASKTGKGEKVY